MNVSRKMKGMGLAALLSLLFVLPAAAQQIKVDAPNIVGADEQFNVTFVIEGEDKPSSFSWNPGSDFKLVWGPQEASSTSISIINGKRSKTSQFTYIYILMPQKKGKCTLPSAVAKFKNREISSPETAIDVLDSGTSSGGAGSSSSSSASGQDAGRSSSRESGGSVSSEDLFLKFSLSRTSAVIGEPITAELKLYQRVDIAGFEGARFPSFNGFWSQETAAPTNIQFQREDVGGTIYNSALLRRYVLIPQQAGELVIDPAELICIVNVRTSSRTGNSIFDSFFDDGYRSVRKRITTPAVKVNVKQLPSGAPADFGGGVGTFRICAKLSKDQLKTHEAASLLVTVSGKGNVSLLEAPKINFPPDIEVYDTKTTESTDRSSGGTSGSKTFEYPFIPRSHGDFTLGPVTYSYYDVNTGKYETVSAGEIQFSVEKGDAAESADSQPSSSLVVPDRKGVKNLGEDIRFIRRDMPSSSFSSDFLVGSARYWIAAILLIVCAAAVWYMMRGMETRRADVAGTRNRKATKMALNRLKTAREYLEKNLYAAFYEELHKALLGFISDKLNIGIEDLSRDNIDAQLQADGVSGELSGRFLDLLDACEYARYSPDSGHEAMNAHYEEAVNVISQLDSIMKNSRKTGKSAGAAVMIAVALLSVPGISRAESSDYADSLWRKGVELYTAGNWSESIRMWESVRKAGVESPELYYNIGNACFKAGENAGAILNYERALKQDPSFADARYNLEFANSLTQDKIEEVPEFLLKSWARHLSYWMDSDSWAVASLAALALALAMVLIFLKGNSVGLRRTGFYSSIVAFILAVCCFSFAQWQKNSYIKADYAIIMKPVSSVKSSPSAESSKDLFVLHEGTKVKVLDSVGQWKNISLSDGRQGWIQDSDMEII